MRYLDIFAGTAIAVLVISTSASLALAKDNGSSGDDHEGQGTVSVHVTASTTVGSRNDENDNNDNNDNRNEQVDENSADASSTKARDNEAEGDNSDVQEGDHHRQDIEGIAHALRGLAQKDENINEEVQSIADEEASSSQEAGQAMNAVAQRNFFLSLLLGTDYKSIGTLKSTLATTQNHIDQLNKVKDKALNAEVKAGIDAQITALQKANSDAEAFVKAHEDSFSVFGWFFRLFSR